MEMACTFIYTQQLYMYIIYNQIICMQVYIMRYTFNSVINYNVYVGDGYDILYIMPNMGLDILHAL